MNNSQLIGNHPKLFAPNNFVPKPMDNERLIGNRPLIFEVKYQRAETDG
jgi:hypothetical protein